MKRPAIRFGLRLILLVVALVAMCLGWLAIRQQPQAYAEKVRRWNLEARISATERWRDEMQQRMKTLFAPGDARATQGQIKTATAEIAAMRKGLH